MRGFEVAQSTVSKYMVRRQNPPSQTWKTFLRNHAGAIAAIDMCVVPTLTFDHLFAFLVLGHGRRQRPRSKAAILLRDHAVQHRYREHGAFSSGMAVTRPRTVFWFGQIMNQALNAMISASLRVPKTLSVLIGGGNHLTFSAQ
jgi:hypothetical protein